MSMSCAAIKVRAALKQTTELARRMHGRIGTCGDDSVDGAGISAAHADGKLSVSSLLLLGDVSFE